LAGTGAKWIGRDNWTPEEDCAIICVDDFFAGERLNAQKGFGGWQMLLPRKTIFLCAGLIMALSGCFENGPDCASDATKVMVAKIVKQHTPQQLFNVATQEGMI
jgi:hypothetical protein